MVYKSMLSTLVSSGPTGREAGSKRTPPATAGTSELQANRWSSGPTSCGWASPRTSQTLRLTFSRKADFCRVRSSIWMADRRKPSKRQVPAFDAKRKPQQGDLLQVGRRHFGDPGVVIGGVAHSFLASTNALLNGGNLLLRESRQPLDALLNRLGLPGCSGFGRHIGCGGISVAVSDADIVLDQVGADLLAVHQRNSNITLPGHYVSNAEYAIAARVPRQIFVREGVIFSPHGDAREDLRYRPDRGNHQRGPQVALRARYRLR